MAKTVVLPPLTRRRHAIDIGPFKVSVVVDNMLVYPVEASVDYAGGEVTIVLDQAPAPKPIELVKAPHP